MFFYITRHTKRIKNKIKKIKFKKLDLKKKLKILKRDIETKKILKIDKKKIYIYIYFF